MAHVLENLVIAIVNHLIPSGRKMEQQFRSNFNESSANKSQF